MRISNNEESAKKSFVFYYTNCFLIRKSDNKVLLSVRADTKAFAPCLYDFSVRGQKWGNALGIMAREIWLQLGIKPNLQHIFSGLKWERENATNYADLFLGYIDKEPAWHNPIEIKELQYKSVEEIQALLESHPEKFIPEFKIGFEKLVEELKKCEFNKNACSLAEICEGSHELQKAQIANALPKQVAQSIESKHWVRFLLLNSLHDSVITDIKFNKKPKILKLSIVPCLSFYGMEVHGKMLLTFYPRNYDFLGIKLLSKIAKKFGLDIADMETHLSDNGEIRIRLYVTCYNGNKTAIRLMNKLSSKALDIDFICDNLEIDG
ncbi:MAG: hypothetical protein FWD49_06395 [Firmicutes bacterium]|nr:hypothetical protein [Bacillota bacterium]